MEAYEFLDVEAALVSHIKSVCRVAASTMVPNPKPVEHVQVIRVGGTADMISDRPMVTFFVSAGSWPNASSLAGLVRRRVMSMDRIGTPEVPVYRVIEIGGPARAPDPVTGDPRYQFTVEFKLRGSKASD